MISVFFMSHDFNALAVGRGFYQLMFKIGKFPVQFFDLNLKKSINPDPSQADSQA